jgi:Fur family transcriptional regulator, ferric uptake regulator
MMATGGKVPSQTVPSVEDSTMPAKKPKEETEVFYAYLRQNGLKKTYQKDLILETFLNAEGHLSVEDIYGLVKKRDKRVGVVTVFRTLKSLTACGIAREITLGDGVTRFEHRYHHPHHHHVVCTQCHKTIEFVSPELERVQLEIVGKYQFEAMHHVFQIYGLCGDCRHDRPIQEVPKHDTEKVFARDALGMAIEMERRGLELYRAVLDRNSDAAGREILESIVAEEERHLGELEAELEDIQRQERGLSDVPMFLHFNKSDLERLVPDLSRYQRDGELSLDPKAVMELAILLERNAAAFFKEYSEKFMETLGKKIFQRFADAELRHCEMISSRLDAFLAVAR